MGLVTNLNNFVWRKCTRWASKEMASSCSVRTMKYICLFYSCLMHEWCVVCLMFVIIMIGYTHAIVVLSYKPHLDQLLCTWYTSWHFTSREILCLVVLQISWYSMSRATPCLMKMKISTEIFWILDANICV